MTAPELDVYDVPVSMDGNRLQDSVTLKFNLFSFLINVLSLNYSSLVFIILMKMCPPKNIFTPLKQISYPDDVSKALWAGKHNVNQLY